MSGRLENKVAIITGAGSGFGEASAKLFAKEGAKVVVADISEENGQRVVAEIKAAGGEAFYVGGDLSEEAGAKNLADQAIAKYGRINILYNNAGIIKKAPDVAHTDVSVFDRVMRVNFRTFWLCSHFVLPYIVKAGGGAVVNTASIVAQGIGGMGGGAYSVSKGAVASLTRLIANEYGMYNVRCNSISPFTALTPPLLARFGDQVKMRTDMVKSRNPMGRMMDIDCVANTALFLASDESNCITGMDIRVDGGAAIQAQPFILDEWVAENDYGVVPYSYIDDGIV